MSKTEETCKKIIFVLLRDGYQEQYSPKQIEKAIMLVRGIDERTNKRWLKALTTFGFLIPKGIGYSINMLTVPEVMQTLKEKPQTKIG